MTTHPGNAHRSGAYVLLPALAMLLVLPPILGLPPLAWPPNLNRFQFMIAAPFWLGVLAAPGYLYAWARPGPASRLRGWPRWWLLLSLAAAAAASLAGMLLTLPILLPVPFALGSAICAAILLSRIIGTGRTHATSGHAV